MPRTDPMTPYRKAESAAHAEQARKTRVASLDVLADRMLADAGVTVAEVNSETNRGRRAAARIAWTAFRVGGLNVAATAHFLGMPPGRTANFIAWHETSHDEQTLYYDRAMAAACEPPVLEGEGLLADGTFARAIQVAAQATKMWPSGIVCGDDSRGNPWTARARDIAAWIGVHWLRQSYPDMAVAFGMRSHASVHRRVKRFDPATGRAELLRCAEIIGIDNPDI